MEVRQARYFLEIADRQSMGRAAAALHLTQPALSQAIAQLERDLGVTLFQRTSRGMRVTDHGQALVAPARRLVEAGRLADSAVQLTGEDAAGTLTIAATPAFVRAPLAGWIAEYRRRFPDVDVRLSRVEGTDPLERLLDRQLADLVIGTSTHAVTERVREVPLGREELVLAVPAHDDPFDDGIVRITELAGRPLIISPPGSSMHTAVSASFVEAGVEVCVGIETMFMDSFAPLVAGGAGWAILPRPHVAGLAEIRVHPLDPAPRRTYSIFLPADGVTLAAQMFVRLARTLSGP